MITRTTATLRSVPAWQQAMANAITDPDELFELLGLPARLRQQAHAACQQFPLRVPVSFVQRMQYGDPDDPLLRQVLPLGYELEEKPGYTQDPVGDLSAMKTTGVLQKYARRVLLIVTGACAVHCRYCFRRHYPYQDAMLTHSQLSAARDYIERDPSINEVILSGGDPLSLSDTRLSEIVAQLESIPHLTRLRIHTRQLIVLPDRLTEELLSLLQRTHLQTSLVVHINHPNEIDANLMNVLLRLKQNVHTLLNQSVLLNGVNDNASVLSQLSQRLFDAGVLPYYLHQLDPVQGAAHFAVSDERALRLIASIQSDLPGYLVPRLVREVVGKTAKTPLSSNQLY